MADRHEMATPYVLDALDLDERRQFEEHLKTCPSCQAEVRELGRGLEVLVSSVAEPAPLDLKADVMSAIDGVASVTHLRPQRWAWAATASILAAAAIAVTIVLFGALDRLDRAEQINAILAAPDATSVDAAVSAVGPARVVFSESSGTGVFLGSSLPDVPEDQTYELWLIDGAGTATPAGLFRPDGGAAAVVLEGVAEPGLTVGLTVEPFTGSQTPTGEVLFAAEL